MKKRKLKVISDVNVTSLVDVTLVLLIVFIIAAPFMRAGVKVDLPKAEHRAPHPKEAILLMIDSQKRVFINQRQVQRAAVVEEIRKLRSGGNDLPVLVEGDASVPYGEVIRVMDQVRSAGVEQVGLVLEYPLRKK